MPTEEKSPEAKVILFRCIKNFAMHDGEIAFTEGKEYEAAPWFSDGVMFRNDQGSPHIMPPHSLGEYFVKVAKVEEVHIIESFIKLCIESLPPDPFNALIDEIVPNLERARHITVRSVEELGREMGVK